MPKNSTLNRSLEILAINTPRGIESLRQNRIALDAIESQSDFELLEFSGTSTSRIDGYIQSRKTKILMGSYEAKSRKISLHTLQTSYQNEMFLDKEKVDNGQKITLLTQVPFYGIFHIIDSDVVMMIKIFSGNGQPACEMYRESNVFNGVRKEMVYINMLTAISYDIPPRKNEFQSELFR